VKLERIIQIAKLKMIQSSMTPHKFHLLSLALLSCLIVLSLILNCHKAHNLILSIRLHMNQTFHSNLKKSNLVKSEKSKANIV